MPEVTILPATKSKQKERLRVAAYARVSDAKDAMVNSLEAQIEYFTKYIKEHPGWEFAGIYADKGITGTKEGRGEFQRMLADCRQKKIDLVITKAISRFARNTVTLLETVRELKARHIGVFFQKEGINTLSGEGEVMLTILASFAQAESLSASENCKWRVRKSFKEGKINGLTMLGYKLHPDGRFTVVPEEASIVKKIFALYIAGTGKEGIANYLNQHGYDSRCGGGWSPNGVRHILTNRKYTGELFLQLTYRKDHLSKKKTVNKGALPMYKIPNHHEAIISAEAFDKVQEMINAKVRKPAESKLSAFTGMIVCSSCGKHYKRKTVGGPTGHAWICSTYNLKGKEYCKEAKRIPGKELYHVTAEVLGQDAFDDVVFKNTILRIEVPRPNVLQYCFRDGTTMIKEWKDRSRKESWTIEMKEKARRKTLCRNRKSW